MAELMRQGLNPDDISLRNVQHYIKNIEYVRDMENPLGEIDAS